MNYVSKDKNLKNLLLISWLKKCHRGLHRTKFHREDFGIAELHKQVACAKNRADTWPRKKKGN